MREPSEHQILMRLIDACKQAAGCAHQMAHAQRNPQWLQVRDSLEATGAMATAMATAKALTQTQTAAALAVRERKMGVVH